MENTALVLVDIQKGFDDIAYWGGNRNNINAEENARQILEAFRRRKLPVFHVKHNSVNKNSRLVPGQYGNEIQDVVKPLATEPVIEKTVNSAFIGTDLHQKLQAQHIQSLIIVGLTTDHCISTTVRMASNLGYKTIVVSDATATFDRVSYTGEKYPAELVHELSLASLHEEFATILATDSVLKSLDLNTTPAIIKHIP
jgi:nicotinamidase-related amidase